jgi:hypothetical protein
VALLAGDGVAHKDLIPSRRPVIDEDEAMAAVEHVGAGAAGSKVEALRRNAVGRVQDGGELDPLVAMLDYAEEGRLPVVGAEEAEELGVGDEPSPARADRGGAGKRGWARREAEEDLTEEIVDFERGGRRRRRCAGEAASRSGALALTHLDGREIDGQVMAAQPETARPRPHTFVQTT